MSSTSLESSWQLHRLALLQAKLRALAPVVSSPTRSVSSHSSSESSSFRRFPRRARPQFAVSQPMLTRIRHFYDEVVRDRMLSADERVHYVATMAGLDEGIVCAVLSRYYGFLPSDAPFVTFGSLARQRKRPVSPFPGDSSSSDSSDAAETETDTEPDVDDAKTVSDGDLTVAFEPVSDAMCSTESEDEPMPDCSSVGDQDQGYEDHLQPLYAPPSPVYDDFPSDWRDDVTLPVSPECSSEEYLSPASSVVFEPVHESAPDPKSTFDWLKYAEEYARSEPLVLEPSHDSLFVANVMITPIYDDYWSEEECTKLRAMCQAGQLSVAQMATELFRSVQEVIEKISAYAMRSSADISF